MRLQECVVDGWESGTVRTLLLKSSMGILEPDEYLNQEIFCVEFPTNLDSEITTVFMSQDTLEFIGYGYSD